MSELQKVLEERGAVYGDYKKGVTLRSCIMDLLHGAHISQHGMDMTLDESGYLWDVVNKLARLAVSPTHRDSWVDIAGYATLAGDAVCPPTPSGALRNSNRID